MPGGKLSDPNVVPTSREGGRHNPPGSYGPPIDAMAHHRDGAEPHAAPRVSAAIQFFEDTQLQDRIRQAGGRGWFWPVAVVRHRGDRRAITPRRIGSPAFSRRRND